MLVRFKGPRLRRSPLAFGDSELEKSSDDRGEAIRHKKLFTKLTTPRSKSDSLLEEKSLVGGVSLDPLLKRLVLNERVVRTGWIDDQ